MNYKIFPAHKRTIFVRYHDDDIERYSVQFPRTLFFETGKSELSCVALNEQNEPCYMPLFNLAAEGNVCLVFEDDEYKKIDFELKIQKFFKEPYKICGDTYSHCIRRYLKIHMANTVDVREIFIPEIKKQLKSLYEKPIKLIKCSEEHAYVPNCLLK